MGSILLSQPETPTSGEFGAATGSRPIIRRESRMTCNAGLSEQRAINAGPDDPGDDRLHARCKCLAGHRHGRESPIHVSEFDRVASALELGLRGDSGKTVIPEPPTSPLTAITEAAAANCDATKQLVVAHGDEQKCELDTRTRRPGQYRTARARKTRPPLYSMVHCLRCTDLSEVA